MTKNSTMSLKLALCGAILWFAAADAYAIITIGDIAVRSFRDEPLEASIELKTDSGEAITLQCLSLSTPDSGAGNNLPYLTDASISLDARDGKQTVRITTTQPFGGDGFNLFLKILCPGQLQVSRDFSVLFGTRTGNVLA
ncbi:MAG: type IV pilus assembly protein FimV, partial [Burkholderiales bacterium]